MIIIMVFAAQAVFHSVFSGSSFTVFAARTVFADFLFRSFSASVLRLLTDFLKYWLLFLLETNLCNIHRPIEVAYYNQYNINLKTEQQNKK